MLTVVNRHLIVVCINIPVISLSINYTRGHEEKNPCSCWLVWTGIS